MTTTTETRTTGYRTISNTQFPIMTILQRNGNRRWIVTTNVCNGVSDYGTSVEFRTLKAARASFNA